MSSSTCAAAYIGGLTYSTTATTPADCDTTCAATPYIGLAYGAACCPSTGVILCVCVTQALFDSGLQPTNNITGTCASCVADAQGTTTSFVTTAFTNYLCGNYYSAMIGVQSSDLYALAIYPNAGVSSTSGSGTPPANNSDSGSGGTQSADTPRLSTGAIAGIAVGAAVVVAVALAVLFLGYARRRNADRKRGPPPEEFRIGTGRAPSGGLAAANRGPPSSQAPPPPLMPQSLAMVGTTQEFGLVPGGGGGSERGPSPAQSPPPRFPETAQHAVEAMADAGFGAPATAEPALDTLTAVVGVRYGARPSSALFSAAPDIKGALTAAAVAELATGKEGAAAATMAKGPSMDVKALPLDNDPRDWSSVQVAGWLVSCGFAEEVVRKFKDNDIDGTVLTSIDLQFLRQEMGIESAGVRARLMMEIGRLRGEGSTSATVAGVPQDAQADGSNLR
ncbi:hypothetical protein HK405_001297, partial [Cladochytrium tenue]